MQLTGGSITLVSVTISNPMTLDYYGNNTTAPNIDLDKHRGTSTSPLVIVTGDELGVINFRGYDTDSLVTGAAIKGISTGTIADTRIPAVLEFWTGTDAAPTVLTKRLTVDEVGKLTVVGAANADKFTITAGDIKLTLGDIRLTDGIITGDLTTDQGNYLKRNQAVTTVPLLELELTNVADDQPALFIDCKATGSVNAIRVETVSTAYGLSISMDNTTAQGIQLVGADALTARFMHMDMGAWVGTVNQGAVEMISDAAATVAVGQAIRVNLRHTGQHSAAIGGSVLYMADAAAAPAAGTSYAVYINATNIEALRVDAGQVLFDEALTITGAADADQLTLTNGDIKLTLGDVRLTNGIVTGDLTTDQTNYLKRNQAVTTGPLLELEVTNVADDNPALLVDFNATGAFNAVRIENAGTAYGVSISVEAATGDGIQIDAVDSLTGRGMLVDLGAWLGTADQGAVELVSDAAATIPAGQVMRLNQQGTGQHAAAIEGSALYVKDAAAAPAAGTSYAVTIDATNIEGLFVKTGLARFDEGASLGNATDSRLRTDTIEITNAQIKALRATPKSLIAAPGADYFVQVESIALILDYGTEVLTESADDLRLRYAGSALGIIGAIEMTSFIDAAADTIMMPTIPDVPFSAATNFVNRAIELVNVGDGEFGGNASNDTTITVKISYRIHKAGL